MIHKIEFGGSPSKLPASASDPRPGTDVYDRRVTELWYQIREFLIAGQIKGLTRDAIQQLSNRRISPRSDRKTKIETKDDFKQRHGYSPDHADSIAVLVALARELGAHASMPSAQRHSQNWLRSAKQFDNVYQHEPNNQAVSRPINAPESTPDAQADFSPFWSHDSQDD